MDWQATSDVNIGDYTKASDHNKVRGNVDYLQALADVQHNFNISTGTGYHKAITQLITDAAAAAVKDLILSEWDPASGTPAIGQAIRWLAKMSDSAGNQDTFGALRWIADAVTSGAEEGRAVLSVIAAGTTTDQIEILKNLMRPSTDNVLAFGSASKRLASVLTNSLGDSAAALSIASSSVRMALQPSFLVIPSGTQTDVTGDGTNYSCVWGSEIKDQGGNFNSNTFTAPVDCTLAVGCSLGISGILSGHTVVTMYLVTSNRTYRKTLNPYALFPAGDELVVERFAIADLDAGDTATVTLQISNGTKVADIVTSSKSYFYGAMIN